MPSLLYTAELALNEEDIQPFLDWYAYRHAPDLYPIGFQSCACYRATIGDMTFFDIYEIPAWEIFMKPAYGLMAERDVYAADILSKRLNKAHTLYEHEQLHPASPERALPLDADWISILRFNASAERDALETVIHQEAARLANAGAKLIRFARRTTDHPTYTTHRPHFMLLAEWPQKPPSEAELFKPVEQQLGGRISDLTPFLGYRVYPWPDRPI